MIQSPFGLRLFSQNKKAETSDRASYVHFDTSKFYFQVITFKKNTVFRNFRKIVINTFFLGNTFMTESRWQNEYDQITTTTNINNWTRPKLKPTNLHYLRGPPNLHACFYATLSTVKFCSKWVGALILTECAIKINQGKHTLCVVYFDQLSGAARTQKLVKTFFSAVFQHIVWERSIMLLSYPLLHVLKSIKYVQLPAKIWYYLIVEI